jgi:hypothetical protein
MHKTSGKVDLSHFNVLKVLVLKSKSEVNWKRFKWEGLVGGA